MQAIGNFSLVKFSSTVSGNLGRLGAKQALQKVAIEANPYGKWVTLTNQTVSLKAFPVLLESTSIFRREQHAFLALWINRYTCGGCRYIN